MISIIIVNWNSGGLLKNVMDSILSYHSNLVDKVVVVDNNSTDESLSNILECECNNFKLDIIRNNQNNGFSKACNQGAEICNSKYLLFLNPDTSLYSDTLLSVYQFMNDKKNSEVGICGIQLVDENGVIQRSCRKFPNVISMLIYNLGLYKLQLLRKYSYTMTDWEHDKNRVVEQVIGAFFFIRRDLFEKLKGFDEQFFVYFEELDLSYRVAQLNYKSYYLVDSCAFHKGGGTSEQVKAIRLFYSLRSRILYVNKHFKPWEARVVTLSTLCLEPLIRTMYGLMSFSFTNVKNTIKGYIMLWKFFLGIK